MCLVRAIYSVVNMSKSTSKRAAILYMQPKPATSRVNIEMTFSNLNVTCVPSLLNYFMYSVHVAFFYLKGSPKYKILFHKINSKHLVASLVDFHLIFSNDLRAILALGTAIGRTRWPQSEIARIKCDFLKVQRN